MGPSVDPSTCCLCTSSLKSPVRIFSFWPLTDSCGVWAGGPGPDLLGAGGEERRGLELGHGRPCRCRTAPGRPVAAARPGSAPRRGVLRPQLQSSRDPPPGDASRALSQAGSAARLPPAAGEGLQGSPWDNRGAQHVVPRRDADEGRVPASQNLVKRGPPGEGTHATSVFLPREPREHNEEGEGHDTGR